LVLKPGMVFLSCFLFFLFFFGCAGDDVLLLCRLTLACHSIRERSLDTYLWRSIHIERQQGPLRESLALRVLARFAREPELASFVREIDVREHILKDNHILASFTNLQRLTMGYTPERQLHSVLAKSLAPALTSLKHLDVSSIWIQNRSDVSVLAEVLRRNSQLEQLVVDVETSVSLRALVLTMAQTTTLTSLSLVTNKLGPVFSPQGWQRLSRLQLLSLTYLNQMHCPIGTYKSFQLLTP
jgi:hypothetical protein